MTLIVTAVSASYIRMNVEIISDEVLYQNPTIVSIFINQSGDETAYDIDVYPLASTGISVDGSLSAETLNPGETLQGNFTISVEGNILQGAYPFVALVKYHDANKHLFSTVYPELLTYGAANSPKVYGTLSELEITEEGSGVTTLTVKNLDYIEHYVKIKLYLPDELKSNVIEKNINIESMDEKEIGINIESFGAILGSYYRTLASLEYEDDDFHYSSFAGGKVKIVEEKSNPYIFWIAIVAFIVLLLVYIYYKLERKTK